MKVKCLLKFVGMRWSIRENITWSQLGMFWTGTSSSGKRLVVIVEWGLWDHLKCLFCFVVVCFGNCTEREAVNASFKGSQLYWMLCYSSCQTWASAGYTNLPACRSLVHSRRRDKHRNGVFSGSDGNVYQIPRLWRGRAYRSRGTGFLEDGSVAGLWMVIRSLQMGRDRRKTGSRQR